MKPLEQDEFIALASKNYVIVDTRPSETFVNGFFKDSISVPFNENFISALQQLTADEQNILLVVNEKDAPLLSKKINSAGIANVYGYLKDEFEFSKIPSKNADMLIAINAEEFGIDYRFDEFFLIDVRTSDEFENEHIEDAENISLHDLDQFLIGMDTAQSYFVYSNSVDETITAGSLFKRNGFNLVKVVAENFDTLKKTEIPFVRKKKGTSKNVFDN